MTSHTGARRLPRDGSAAGKACAARCWVCEPTFHDPRQRASMAEEPHAGEYHSDIVLVGGADDFVVAQRAAGMDHGAHADFGGAVEAVAEREEGIGGHPE